MTIADVILRKKVAAAIVLSFTLLGAASAQAGLVAEKWYFGTWNCLIDGRPSTMVWKVVDAPQQTCNGSVCTQNSDVAIRGWFREKRGPWVRLFLADSTDRGIAMMYNNVDPWVLNRREPGHAVGHTTWHGNRYPLECRK
jgi:hypothetical protein